jgi:anti-sigma B factor antagonist
MRVVRDRLGVLFGACELLRMSTDTLATTIVVTVSGDVDIDIDIDTAGYLEELLEGSIAPQRTVVLDMDEISFFGSAGLPVLLSARRWAGDVDARLRLACPSPEARRAVEVTALHDVLPMFDSVAEATAG